MKDATFIVAGDLEGEILLMLLSLIIIYEKGVEIIKCVETP